MKSLTIFAVLLLLGVSAAHECIHDKMEHNPGFHRIHSDPEEGRRILDSQEWRPIRIAFNYDSLTVVSEDQKNYLKNHVLPAVKEFFEGVISVKPVPSSGLKFDKSSLSYGAPCNYSSDAIFNTTYDADMVIFINDKGVGENAVASATYCILSETDARPLLSVVSYQPAQLTRSFEDTLATTTHELTHAFGFSAYLFPYFNTVPIRKPNSNKARPVENYEWRQTINTTGKIKVGEKEYNAIILPDIVKIAKKHFGCDELKGAPLENEGGAGTTGSHWERRFFGNEVMTGSAVAMRRRFTSFTLTLLNSIGWYKINFAAAQATDWGRGEGCKFFSEDCINKNQKATLREYCDSEGNQCSYDGRTVINCGFKNNDESKNHWFGDNTTGLDQFADECPIGYITESIRDSRAIPTARCFDEKNAVPAGVNVKYGSESRCFEGTLLKNGYVFNASYVRLNCYNIECRRDDKNIATLFVDVGANKLIECPRNGSRVENIPGHFGYLECPPAEAYCTERFRYRYNPLTNKDEKFDYDPYLEDKYYPINPEDGQMGKVLSQRLNVTVPSAPVVPPTPSAPVVATSA